MLNGLLDNAVWQRAPIYADFETVEAYEEWLRNVVARRNRGRQKRFNEELVAMRKVDVRRLAEFVEIDVRVTSWSTIRVKHCAYSVPSRLIVFTMRLVVYTSAAIA